MTKKKNNSKKAATEIESRAAFLLRIKKQLDENEIQETAKPKKRSRQTETQAKAKRNSNKQGAKQNDSRSKDILPTGKSIRAGDRKDNKGDTNKSKHKPRISKKQLEAEKRSKAAKKGWLTRQAKAREKEQQARKERPPRQRKRGQYKTKPRRPYNQDVKHDIVELVVEKGKHVSVEWFGQFATIKKDQTLLDFEHFVDEVLSDFFEEARELKINSPHVVWWIENWEKHQYILKLEKTVFTGLSDFDLGQYFFNYF